MQKKTIWGDADCESRTHDLPFDLQNDILRKGRYNQLGETGIYLFIYLLKRKW
jgi:hypothetical protein